MVVMPASHGTGRSSSFFAIVRECTGRVLFRVLFVCAMPLFQEEDEEDSEGEGEEVGSILWPHGQLSRTPG